MRVVDPAQLLQAAPHITAAARGVDQLVLDSDPVKDIPLVDHQDVRHFLGRAAGVASQSLAHRDHTLVPLAARNSRKARGVTRIACHEVDERKGHVLRNSLKIFVLVHETVDRPIEIRLRIVADAETGRPIRSRGRVVGESRKGARLHRRGRHEIGGQVGNIPRFARRVPGRAREYAEQRRPGNRQSSQDPIPQLIKMRAARLQHVGTGETDGHAGKLEALDTHDTERELSGPAGHSRQDVVALDQDLDRQARGKDLDRLRLLCGIVGVVADADQIRRKRREILRDQRTLVKPAEKRIVP